MAWGQEKGTDVKISALPVSMRFFDFVPCSLPLKTLILLTFSCFLIRRRGKEWLLYSRFREEIPKAILVLYFVILAVHPAAMLVCYVVHCTKASVGISTGAAYFILFFNAAWTSVLSLLFRPGKDKRIRYERWIKRRRGQTPRKK